MRTTLGLTKKGLIVTALFPFLLGVPDVSKAADTAPSPRRVVNDLGEPESMHELLNRFFDDRFSWAPYQHESLSPHAKVSRKATRGWLGIVIQEVTPAIAESIGLDKAKGALVSFVSKDGPADQGGIEVGDVIVEFNGTIITESSDLPFIVSRIPVDRKISLKVLREGEEVELPVTIGELKEKQVKEKQVVVSLKGETDLGLTVQKVTREISESLGLGGAAGVVITSVELGSLTDEAGLRRGDIIREINRESIGDLTDFQKAITKIEKGKSVLFLVQRGETTLFLAMKSQRHKG